jgi:hypothetical protein
MEKGFLIGVSILTSVIILVTVFYLFSPPDFFCNDGTSFNNCSKIKPYFCLNGTLIENIPACGCGDFSMVEHGKCISAYQFGPKKIQLNYTLNGKKSSIDFVVYENLSNYLSAIPRYIETVDGEEATLLDFKLKSLDEKEQRELLLPLVIAIENITKDKDDQARIAISIIQNIPFGNSNKTIRFGDTSIDYYRYPYEVLYDFQGVCGEKSELLSFILRELGYDNAFLYYAKENHEAMGIRCPTEKSMNNTGYCFIETTGPSIITDSNTEYIGVVKLRSFPQIIPIEGNLTFGKTNFYEYNDAKSLNNIRTLIKKYGEINIFQHFQFRDLVKKYGLETFEYTF